MSIHESYLSLEIVVQLQVPNPIPESKSQVPEYPALQQHSPLFSSALQALILSRFNLSNVNMKRLGQKEYTQKTFPSSHSLNNRSSTLPLSPHPFICSNTHCLPNTVFFAYQTLTDYSATPLLHLSTFPSCSFICSITMSTHGLAQLA